MTPKKERLIIDALSTSAGKALLRKSIREGFRVAVAKFPVGSFRWWLATTMLHSLGNTPHKLLN